MRNNCVNTIFIFTRKITGKKLLTEMRNKWEKIPKFLWETNLFQHFFLMRKKSHKISCWFFNEFSIRTHTEKLFVTLLSLCMKRGLWELMICEILFLTNWEKNENKNIMRSHNFSIENWSLGRGSFKLLEKEYSKIK